MALRALFLVSLMLAGAAASPRRAVDPSQPRFSRHGGRPASLPAGAPTSPWRAADTGNVSVVWNVSMWDQWYAGVSLVTGPAGVVDYMVTGGNWYHEPYPFFLAGGALASPVVAWNVTDIVPGSVWPSAGASAFAAYTGLDFTTFATTAAVFGAGGGGFPAWSATFPPETDNIWETGPAAALSADGSIVAAAATRISNITNPTANPKNAEVEVVTTEYPPRVLVQDSLPDATALMFVKLSGDGSTAVVVSAQQPNGSIDSSYVRVYNTTSGAVLASLTTQYAWAGCLSPSGEYLLLATTDSEDRLEAYRIAADGSVVQTMNASYPTFPSAPTNKLTFAFAAACRVNDAGVAVVTFSLWWNGVENQTAVAAFQLPATPDPLWLWTSTPVAPTLQDDPQTDAMTPDGALYAFSSWGGEPVNASAPQPATMHVFNVSAGTVVAEIATPGSLEAFDMAYDPSSGGGALFVLAEGLDAHANRGNDGGVLNLWRIEL